MKFYKFEAQTTKKMFKIKPVAFFNSIIYKRLDFLLGFIKKNNQKTYKDYVNQLTDDFQSLVKSSSSENYRIDDLSKFKNIQSNMKLARLHGDLIKQILGVSFDQANSSDEIEIPSRIYWRASLLARYNQLLSLIKTLGRDEAISLFKQYLDQYYVFTKSTFTNYETLDEFFDFLIEDAKTSTDGEFDVTCSSVENGVLIIRNNNCPAVEALDDTEDKELIYVIICYPDYQWAVMTNDHFVMTRKYTVAEGDPYCDKVLHDKRIDKELKHPSKKFIDSMDSKIEARY
jgi:hypothetical protein